MIQGIRQRVRRTDVLQRLLIKTLISIVTKWEQKKNAEESEIVEKCDSISSGLLKDEKRNSTIVTVFIVFPPKKITDVSTRNHVELKTSGIV